MDDDWDPNVLLNTRDACRIYGDEKMTIFALVDEIDFSFLSQWRWSPKWSRGGRKVYLRRNVQIGPRATRIQRNLFLHQAVMERMGIKPPDEHHVLIDHRNGDSLDCRRANIRWATHKTNRHNIHGKHFWEALL